MSELLELAEDAALARLMLTHAAKWPAMIEALKMGERLSSSSSTKASLREAWQSLTDAHRALVDLAEVTDHAGRFHPSAEQAVNATLRDALAKLATYDHATAEKDRDREKRIADPPTFKRSQTEMFSFFGAPWRLDLQNLAIWGRGWIVDAGGRNLGIGIELRHEAKSEILVDGETAVITKWIDTPQGKERGRACELLPEIITLLQAIRVGDKTLAEIGAEAELIMEHIESGNAKGDMLPALRKLQNPNQVQA